MFVIVVQPGMGISRDGHVLFDRNIHPVIAAHGIALAIDAVIPPGFWSLNTDNPANHRSCKVRLCLCAYFFINNRFCFTVICNLLLSVVTRRLCTVIVQNAPAARICGTLITGRRFIAKRCLSSAIICARCSTAQTHCRGEVQNSLPIVAVGAGSVQAVVVDVSIFAGCCCHGVMPPLLSIFLISQHICHFSKCRYGCFRQPNGRFLGRFAGHQPIRPQTNPH